MAAETCKLDLNKMVNSGFIKLEAELLMKPAYCIATYTDVCSDDHEVRHGGQVIWDLHT